MTSEPSDQLAGLPASLTHYLQMWNERDMDLVRGNLDLAVSDECIWTDPANQHVGRDGLEANVREFRSNFPTADLAIASDIDHHPRRYQYEWIITDGDQIVLRGFDVTTLDAAGLIERVDGFFGALERVGPDID